jgi:hypothetical protein
MLNVLVTLILFNEKSVLEKLRVTHNYTQLTFQYPHMYVGSANCLQLY